MDRSINSVGISRRKYIRSLRPLFHVFLQVIKVPVPVCMPPEVLSSGLSRKRAQSGRSPAEIAIRPRLKALDSEPVHRLCSCAE